MRRKVFVVAGAIIAAAAVVAGGFAWRDSKAASFLRLVWSRDEHCSVGQAWECVGDRGDTWDRRDEVAEQFRVLESQSGFELVEAPQGRFWIPVRNREVLAEMLVDEEHEVYGAGGRGVHPGDTVLDCGANIGVFTRHALERGARLVVAIEPAPENLYCLRRNLAEQIQAERVIVYPKGVWDRDDELVLRTFDAQSGGDSVALRFPGSREGPKVQLTTIDKLTAELHLERVDFIKMDIEGAEPQALTGALRTVARFRPRMAVSMEHRPDDIRAIPALVRRLWPELRSECGPCVWVGTALVDRVQPDVLFVEP